MPCINENKSTFLVYRHGEQLSFYSFLNIRPLNNSKQLDTDYMKMPSKVSLLLCRRSHELQSIIIQLGLDTVIKLIIYRILFFFVSHLWKAAISMEPYPPIQCELFKEIFECIIELNIEYICKTFSWECVSNGETCYEALNRWRKQVFCYERNFINVFILETRHEICMLLII